MHLSLRPCQHGPSADMAPGDAPVRAVSRVWNLSQFEQGPWGRGRTGVYEQIKWSCGPAACGTLGAVALAGVGCDVGVVGAGAGRSAAPLSLPGAPSLSGARLPGRNAVRADHRYALVAAALPAAGVAERRDLPASARGVGAAGAARAGAAAAAAAVARRGQARLVAADRRRVAGGGEKGGEKVARTLRGSPGSRYHLAVDANGLPLEIRLAAGNENEQRHLLPLLDALAARDIRPAELWADRGYASQRLEAALRARRIEPRISKPRRAGDPIPAGTPTREVWRGRRRRLKTRDPQARHRWPVERTNAWLKAMRRIATRHDRKADTYLAFLHLGMIVILTRSI
jgi:transposase